MSRTASSSTVNKFTVWGVILIIAAVALTALAIVIGDGSLVTMTALPVGLLGAAMFYRNHLDRRSAQ